MFDQPKSNIDLPSQAKLGKSLVSQDKMRKKSRQTIKHEQDKQAKQDNPSASKATYQHTLGSYPVYPSGLNQEPKG